LQVQVKPAKTGTKTTFLNDLHLLYTLKEYKVQYKQSLMSGKHNKLKEYKLKKKKIQMHMYITAVIAITEKNLINEVFYLEQSA
jgi:hypothetical protein